MFKDGEPQAPESCILDCSVRYAICYIYFSTVNCYNYSNSFINWVDNENNPESKNTHTQDK